VDLGPGTGVSWESEELQDFVADARTRPGFGQRLRDVLGEKLPARIWVDACALTGDVTLSALLIGGTSDSELPAELKDAYRLAFPGEHAERSLAEFLQSKSRDLEALRGVASVLKGKLYEMAYVEHLNAGHLAEGHFARLAESATQPGFDIEIVGSGGEVLDRINAKATSSGDYVREHLERYPAIDAVTTVEAAAELPDVTVIRFGSIEDLDGSVTQVAEAQSGHLDSLGSLPWVSMCLLGHEAWRQAYVQREPARVVIENAARHGLWLGLGTVASKTGAVIAGPAGAVAGIVLYSGLRQRWSSQELQHDALEGYREHARSVRAVLVGEEPTIGTGAA